MTKTLDENFIDWESSAFGLGYGTGEIHTLGALKNVLDCMGRDGSPAGYDYQKLEEAVTPPVAWMVITLLCRHHILEYGTSPRYGWLTEQGKALKAFVDAKSVDELVALVCDKTEDTNICYPDACNCGPHGYEEGRVCENPFWWRR